MTLTFSEAVATFTDVSGKEPPDSLSTICSDLFTIVITINNTINMGKPEDCRTIINYHIRRFEQQAASIQINPQIIEKAKYAIVILIDEKMSHLPKSWFDTWSKKTLQDEHFGETVGGVRFFDYLDELLRNPEDNGEILEIFYLCLGMGFTGKYQQKPEKLKTIIQQLGKIVLSNHKEKSREINGFPPAGTKKTPTRKLAPRVPLWLLILITLTIIIGSRLIVSMKLNDGFNDLPSVPAGEDSEK